MTLPFAFASSRTYNCWIKQHSKIDPIFGIHCLVAESSLSCNAELLIIIIKTRYSKFWESSFESHASLLCFSTNQSLFAHFFWLPAFLYLYTFVRKIFRFFPILFYLCLGYGMIQLWKSWGKCFRSSLMSSFPHYFNSKVWAFLRFYLDGNMENVVTSLLLISQGGGNISFAQYLCFTLIIVKRHHFSKWLS